MEMNSPDGFLLIDNNVVGPWMRNNDFYTELYDRVHKFTALQRLETCPTAAGYLEFVGTRFPPSPTHIEPSKSLKDELAEVERNIKPNFSDVVERIKLDLYEKFLAWAKEQACFGAATLRREYTNRVSRLDEHNRKIIDSMYGSCIDGDGIEFLFSRLGLYYLHTFDIAALGRHPDLFKTVDASYFVDLCKVHQDALNIPSVRGIERMWKNFSEHSLGMAERGEQKLKITLDQFRENIKTASGHFSFAPDREYLDLEAIHASCLGKHRRGAIFPSVVVTAEAPSTVLYRVAMYRSFVRLAFEEFESLKEQSPLQPKDGFIFIVDKSQPGKPRIEREIVVKNVPGVFPKLDTIVLQPDRYP